MADYRKVRVADLPDTPNPTDHKKEVDEAVGATAFGFNVYEAAPGQRLPWGRHRHPSHEELFYVTAGQIVVEFETGNVTVSEGEALYVPPDTRNLARADGETPATVVAVGAPKETDDAVISEPCPACGEYSDRRTDADATSETYVLYCTACGAEVERFKAGPGSPD